MTINKLQKAKNLLKESINKKETNSIIDTNVYIDKLKYDENPNSIYDNTSEHINKFDVNKIMSFFINYKFLYLI